MIVKHFQFGPLSFEYLRYFRIKQRLVSKNTLVLMSIKQNFSLIYAKYPVFLPR